MNFFEFENKNPLNKRELDCVCRAISNALDTNYYIIKNKLELIGALFECEKLCVCCYQFLLNDFYHLKQIEGFKDTILRDFLKKNKRGKYLIRLDGHLTYCENGVCYDIFDCTNEEIDIIWKI